MTLSADEDLAHSAGLAEVPTVPRSRGWVGKRRDPLVGAVAVLIGIGVWQGTSLFMSPFFISTPSRVFPTIYRLIFSGPLSGAFLRSLLEMLVAMLVAMALGVGIGLLMGRIKVIERALEPLVALGNATPPIALLPVMEVWFGFGELARTSFIVLIGIWPLLVNTHAGVRAVRGGLGDVASALGMSKWQEIRYVYLPGSIPFILVGARIALAVGTVGMILGGQEIGEVGLGGLVEKFGSYSEIPQLVGTILITCLFALLLFWGLRVLQQRAFPWIAATSGQRRGAH